MPCSGTACWSSRWFGQRRKRSPAGSTFVLPRKGNIMQDRPEQTSFDNPLRHLTPAEFMALGGNAVVYVKSIKGAKLSQMMSEIEDGGEDDAEVDYQIVVSADGQPLLVADSEEAVSDWLSDKNYGVVTLH